MNSMPFVIALGLTGALAVWGVGRALVALLQRDRARLQERLSAEWRPEDDPLARRHVRLAPTEAGLAGALTRRPFFYRLNRRLSQAYPDLSLTRFLAIVVSIALFLFALVTMVTASVALAAAIAGAGGYVPFVLVNARRARRQRAMAAQLPEALDFLCRVLRAGHSLSTGLQMMGQELPQPLAGEFARCYDQHSLGQPLEEALREMAERIESSDFAFFVTAVLIQRQTGGDLSEVLNNISNMIRQRIRLLQHVKAITAEGRLTGYILVAFPAVLFVISYFVNPTYAGVLVHSSGGRMLLLGAFALQIIGLVFIRKIVAVKV